MRVTWGREHERLALQAAVDRGNSVLLTGPMGVGKTQLLRQLVADRSDDQWIGLVVANEAASTVPFGAVAAWLPDIDTNAPAALIRAAVRRLESLAGGRQAIVVVDDANHLDPASTALLYEVCAVRGTPLVAAMRSGQQLPAAVVELCQRLGCDYVELGPLDPVAARELVASRLGAATDDPRIDALVKRARGNPLLLTELVLAHLANQQDGLTDHLVELVRARLATLSHDAHSLLELVMIGEPLPADLDIVDHGLLVGLERSALVGTSHDADGATVIRSAHPLYSEVILRQMTPVARRLAAKRLADSMLQSSARRRGDALRLAGWLLEVGEVPDPLLAAAAAREAVVWSQPELASRLVHIALDGEPARYEAWYVAGHLSQISGDTTTALQHFHRALDAAVHDDDVCEATEALMQIYTLFNDDPGAASNVVNQAIDRVTDPPHRQKLILDRILLHTWAGQVGDASVATAELLADEDSDARVEWTARMNALFVEEHLMRLTDADDHLSHLEQVLPDAGIATPAGLDMLHSREVAIRIEQGRLHAAVEAADRWLDRASQTQAPRHLTTLALGHARWMLGDVAGARATLDTALTEIDHYNMINATPQVISLAATLAVIDGDRATAEQMLATGDQSVGADSPHNQIWRLRAEGWMAAATDSVAAVTAFIEAATVGFGGIYLDHALLALHDAVLFDGADRLGAELAHLENAPLNAPFMTLLIDHAKARANNDLDTIVSCAKRFETCGAGWYAANTWQAAARQHHDPVHRARAATRAVMLAPSAALGPHARETAGWALSRRRIDIAKRAAAGASSRSIADELFLSVRTVENNLRQIYRMLDVDNRTNLAPVLAPGRRTAASTPPHHT